MSRISLTILLYALILAFVLGGCGRQSKTLNERMTLWRNDKIPYGTWYAHEQLNRIFPKAVIKDSRKAPDPYGADDGETNYYDKKKMSYVIISTRVLATGREREALFNMVSQGAQVFISSFNISEELLDSLGLKVALYNTFTDYGYSSKPDSLKVQVMNPGTGMMDSFAYPGRGMGNYFSVVDSSITTVLGKDAEGHANFVRISYESGGAFYMHLAPTALTNFFLLHKNNKAYYDEALSWLPNSTEVVRWDDYFRNSTGQNNDDVNSSFSALGWLMKQPGLYWFWILFLVLILLIYIFESKRKQRVIPLITPLRNASLDFVTTIGRLYFQRKDNRDLAHKMGVHFLSYVRSRYNIRMSEMNEEFVKKLAYKSGYDQEAVHALVYELKYAMDAGQYSDMALLELNHRLQNFYNYNA